MRWQKQQGSLAAVLQARKSQQRSESQGGRSFAHLVNKPLAPNQEHPYSWAEHRVGPPGFFWLEGRKQLHSHTHTGAQEGANISPPPPSRFTLVNPRLGVTRRSSILSIQPWALWGGLREKVLRKCPGKVRGSQPLPKQVQPREKSHLEQAQPRASATQRKSLPEQAPPREAPPREIPNQEKPCPGKLRPGKSLLKASPAQNKPCPDPLLFPYLFPSS